VRFQAVKDLTDSANDVVVDYVTLGDAQGGGRRVFAQIARREVVETYMQLCHAAGLKLAGLTPRSIGIGVCAQKVQGTIGVTPWLSTVEEQADPARTGISGSASVGQGDGPLAVVTISDRWAEFCVVQRGTVLLTRPLLLGSGIAGDIRRSLIVYQGQAPTASVRAVYLAGKITPELRQRLMDMIDLTLYSFDPFAATETLQPPEMDAGPRGTFAGAVGLLLARADGTLPINFTLPRQPRAKRDPNLLKGILAVALLLILLAGVGYYFRTVLTDKQEELARLNLERTGIVGQVTKLKNDNKNLQALVDWDQPVLLDELYDLTHRIPDVNALRVRSITVQPVRATAKSTHVAVITIKGNLLDSREPRKALNQLIAEFRKDRYYSPQAPEVKGDEFTLEVWMERRGPKSYERVLDPVS
jgi:hypothetical protein